MTEARKILGPARGFVMEALRSDNTQSFIIDAGAGGAKKNEIVRFVETHTDFLNRDFENPEVRYTEWGMMRFFLRTLGYRSTRQTGWRWVHPHYYCEAVPLMPVRNGITYLNGTPKGNNLTETERRRGGGIGMPRSWDDTSDLKSNHGNNAEAARAARTEYGTESNLETREKLEPKEGEIIVKAHTRAGGDIEIPAHTRPKPTFKGRKPKINIEDLFEEPEPERPSFVKAVVDKVRGLTIREFEPEDAPELEPTQEIILRISVPQGVNVTIKGDRPKQPTAVVEVVDGSTVVEVEDIHRPLTGSERDDYRSQRKLLIGQKITQPGHFEGQVVLDHVVGSQYIVGFSRYGDGREYAYHKKQGLEGSNITSEMNGGWRPWVSVDD